MHSFSSSSANGTTGYAAALKAKALQQPNTEAMCLDAVQRDGLALRQVRHQTPAICLAAVKQNWRAIAYCRHFTEPVVTTAVRGDPSAILHIPPRLHFVGVGANPKAIFHLDCADQDVVMAALRSASHHEDHGLFTTILERKAVDPEMAHILLQTASGLFARFPESWRVVEAIATEAVRLCPVNIKYVVHQTEALATLACYGNPSMIRYIHEPSVALCADVVSRWPHTLSYISSSSVANTFEVVVAAVKKRPDVLERAQSRVWDIWMAARYVLLPPKSELGQLLKHIWRSVRPAPKDLGPVEDPITLDEVPPETACAFFRSPERRGGSWHFAGTASTLVDFAVTGYHGSDCRRGVFVPLKNAVVPYKELVWFQTPG